LRGDKTIYIAFIDWIAATAPQKGRKNSQKTYKYLLVPKNDNKQLFHIHFYLLRTTRKIGH